MSRPETTRRTNSKTYLMGPRVLFMLDDKPCCLFEAHMVVQWWGFVLGSVSGHRRGWSAKSTVVEGKQSSKSVQQRTPRCES